MMTKTSNDDLNVMAAVIKQLAEQKMAANPGMAYSTAHRAVLQEHPLLKERQLALMRNKDRVSRPDAELLGLDEWFAKRTRERVAASTGMSYGEAYRLVLSENPVQKQRRMELLRREADASVAL